MFGDQPARDIDQFLLLSCEALIKRLNALIARAVA